MNIRIASTLGWAYPVEKLVKLIESEEITGIEVWAEHVWKYKSSPQAIGKAKKEKNIEFTMHAASWDLNLCALNSGIRKQSVQEIIRSIELALQIGANNITFHPGKLTLESLEVSWHEELLFESMEKIYEKAKQEGVIMSLEMMEWRKKEFVIEPSCIKRLIKPFSPYIQTTFDIAHIPFHLDIFSIWRQMPDVSKIHISDATDKILHLPLGDGDIGRETLNKFLYMDGIPVVIEGFDPSQELFGLKKNLTYVKRNAKLLKEGIC